MHEVYIKQCSKNKNSKNYNTHDHVSPSMDEYLGKIYETHRCGTISIDGWDFSPESYVILTPENRDKYYKIAKNKG